MRILFAFILIVKIGYSQFTIDAIHHVALHKPYTNLANNYISNTGNKISSTITDANLAYSMNKSNVVFDVGFSFRFIDYAVRNRTETIYLHDKDSLYALSGDYFVKSFSAGLKETCVGSLS
jgi:glyoxylate utilization-related uncharacterized protein